MLRVRLFNSGRLREKSCHRCSVPEKILKSFAKAEEPNKYVGKKTSIHIRRMYLKVTPVTDTVLIMATKHLGHV